jgi:Tfp pilus assembly protein PilF
MRGAMHGAEGGPRWGDAEPRRADAEPRRAEVDALRAQLSAHPADAPLHVRLAAALLAQREVLAASESVARALYLDPLDEDALMLAARIADERGATADADRYRQRALRVHLARMQRDGGA